MSHIRGGGMTQGQQQQQQHGGNKGMVVGAVVYNPNPQMAPATVSPVLKPGGAAGLSGMMAGKIDNQPSFNGNATAPSADHESGDGSLLANTKEKTPMCLINELARYNKIQHQYTLVDEQGPAHKKIFFVKLKLGEEEYSAKGPSIKKAQHSAAGIALEKTQFKHPPPRPRKIMPVHGGGYRYLYSEREGASMIHDSAEYKQADTYSDMDNNITPTVRLNALAMKRCERPIYAPIEPQRPHFYPQANYDYRGMYNQRYHYPRVPKIFYVSLKVGQREFIGEGHSRQAARHCAAEKALKVLGNLPLPNQDTAKPIEVADGGEAENHPDDLKSEISLVHEIGIKRGVPVDFEVISESGQPHMRSYVTRCTVGDIAETKGEGNGKKISKKRAAKAMLDELRKLAPLPSMVATSVKVKPKNPVNKKKNRNLIKMQKACPDYGLGINPISRLIQIQQAKKEKDPIYTLAEERGQPRRREFVMQVQVGSSIAEGVGPNKRFAKRAAAEAMLQLLGYSKPSPQPDKPALKTGVNGGITSPNELNKKVTFVDQDHTVGRQLVPGVILMPGSDMGLHRVPGGPMQMGDSTVSPRTTAVIAKELLDKGASPTAEAMRKAGARPPAQHVVEPSMQLHYLAEVLGFQVQFTDFPKGNNKNEFLSLVSLSTNPPQVSHGAGVTIEASHDAAALTALRSLAEMGIDSVTDVKCMKKDLAAGDAFWWDEKADVHADD
ncbi:double-stranded RNA-binding protein Staufen homolog 2-like isoform X2 [Lineus longissimus]|uniref:double-stranded RNA-binding protein Staufen homolog 2-like isoform X2 n=1 Tax=Lineus longissimus TaxID=88925 RepID=UPI00315D4670